MALNGFELVGKYKGLPINNQLLKRLQEIEVYEAMFPSEDNIYIIYNPATKESISIKRIVDDETTFDKDLETNIKTYFPNR